MVIINFLNWLNSILWAYPLLFFTLFVGLFFMIRGGFFPFAHFRHTLKNTVFAKASESGKSEKGKVSPYRAFCIALGGAVGMGNISGVATAIAVGGPGAIFWMWLWAFFGMIVKMAEITLGVYYRHRGADGKVSGTAMDFMERGIKGEKGLRIGGPLAILMAIGLFFQFVQGSGTYTVAETLHASFGWNIMAVGIVYTLFVVYLMIRGENAIGKMAEKLVPIMVGLYLIGTLIIIGMNISNVPGVFVAIFKGAFTGTAAVGGFAGTTVAVAMRQGISRSIYSNEAGKGSSTLIHGSADTIHPVRQGLWGSVEVVADTLIVCTCTALAIMVTGTWESGLTGAKLGVMAFSSSFGSFGRVFVGVMTLIFAFTTSTAWYILYQNILTYMFRNAADKTQKSIHRIFSVVFPLTMVGTCAFIYFTGSNSGLFWTIVSIVTAFPTLWNGIGLLFLNGKFKALLNDYKARYMGIGKVDPDFIPFAEDDEQVMAKIHANLGE